ncbi:hypothetical protein SEPCBS119000_004889 [Sporothrix epigloea]|uniref:Uncharacterized protein n=1 Tax=Sporothrix epigloea TaxID=1892477 RepID=A0ABP0DUM6_9PEZI
MPPVHPVLVSAGVVAISMAIAVAIAVYEHPETRRNAEEIRRKAEDLRRRMVVAAQSFHDNILANNSEQQQDQQRDGQRDGQENEPVFNRPEDAEGFLMSGGRRSANDPGVDADEASRRRQREELMYWNTVREAKAEADRRMEQVSTSSTAAQRQKALYDEIMQQDYIGGHGTTVMNTGANVSRTAADGGPLHGGLVHRRRPEGARSSLRAAAAYSNPFGDEYGIEPGDVGDISQSARGDRTATAAEAFESRTAYIAASERDETISDIYSATEPDTNPNANRTAMDAVFDPLPAISETAQADSSPAASSEPFFNVRDYTDEERNGSPATLADSYANLSLQLTRRANSADESTELVQAQAYDTIQAWAQALDEAQSLNAAGPKTTTASSQSTPSFYSPLPMTPSVARSAPSYIASSNSSEAGELTPTGSVFGDDHSVIDHADAASTRSSAADSAVLLEQASAVSDYGVVSESGSEEDGHNMAIMTPTSWSEVGSVVSEDEERPVLA